MPAALVQLTAHGTAGRERPYASILMLWPGSTSGSVSYGTSSPPENAGSSVSLDWTQDRLPTSSRGRLEAAAATYSGWYFIGPEEYGWRARAQTTFGIGQGAVDLIIQPDLGESIGDLVRITLDAHMEAEIDGVQVSFSVGFRAENGQAGVLLQGDQDLLGPASGSTVIYGRVGGQVTLFAQVSGKALASETPDGWRDVAGSIRLGLDYEVSAAETPIRATHPLYLDYGADGIWAWGEGAKMQAVAPGDAEALATSPDGTLYIDYGAARGPGETRPRGLWRWTPRGGLARLDEVDPQGMAPAPDGSLYLDLGADGLWKRTAAGKELANAADPQGMAASPDGALFLDYGVFGLWRRDGAATTRINPADPQAIAAAPDGSLFVDYGPYGLWRWSRAGMSQLNAADPQAMLAAADGSLFVDYGRHGLWRWTADAIARISDDDPASMAAGGDGQVFVAFAGSELLRWSQATGLSQLKMAKPRRIAAV